MESLKKFRGTFDVFLVGGVGCGFLALCILMGLFAYLWRNPPSLSSAATQTPVDFAASPGVTPVGQTPEFGVSTPILSPTPVPTLDGAGLATLVPSFIPDFGGASTPSGKIVFACYTNQIDQVCIMNADGTGRKQLTNFPATAFYPSLSPDGQTIYFSSHQSGNFEIYSIDINGNGLQRLRRTALRLPRPRAR